MRIGINALHVWPKDFTSSSVYLCNLVPRLARLDRENQYILFVPSGCEDLWPGDLPNLSPVSVRMPSRSSFSRVAVENVVLPVQAYRHNIDVLFVPLSVRPLVVPCRSLLAVHVIPDGEWLMSVGVAKRVYYRTLFKLSTRLASRILTVSELAKAELVRNFQIPSDKVDVVYHGVAPMFGPARRTQSREVARKHGIARDYLLAVVSVNIAHKNLRGVLDAYSLLRSRHGIPHQLALVGDVSRNDVAGFDDVVCTGRLDHPELAALYAGAKAFVDLSFCESFGLPVLEAMASGTPVVVSNVTATAEIAGEAGLAVDPHDAGGAADALFRVLSDQALAADMSARGIRRAMQFTWERTAARTIEALRRAFSQ